MQKLSLNMKIMIGSSLLVLIGCLLALLALDGQRNLHIPGQLKNRLPDASLQC